jgi:hypothetical protein
MHMQEGTGQPQQYGDAFAQQGRSIDVHEDKKLAGRCQHAERRS